MIEHAVATGLPIDVTGQAILCGPLLRESTSPVVYCLSDEYIRVTGGPMSHNVVQAELVQLLSSLGRTSVDIVLIPIRRRPEDAQMFAALDALQEAREDGLIGHLGFKAVGGPFAVMSTWTLFDAFELAVLPAENGELLELAMPMAQERRVGVVFAGQGPAGHPSILPVSTIAEIDEVLARA